MRGGGSTIVSNVRIGLATDQALPAVRELIVATWHATYNSIYGVDAVTAITDDWHSLPNLAKGLPRDGHVFLLAEQDGELVGTASATDRGNGVVWLDRLYVHPLHQGKGIGTALLQAVRAAFPLASVCRLEVESRNAGGVSFYRRAGFTGDEPGFCRHDAKAVVLEKHWAKGD